MNKFLDKDFYQKAMELLDKETLDNVNRFFWQFNAILDGNDHCGEDFGEI